MLKRHIVSLLITGFILSSYSFAFEREIAITIDDLPFVGTTDNDRGKLKRVQEHIMRLMQALVENNVPATGFVIAGNIENGQWEILEQLQQAGFTLGNHTYSHGDLNTMRSKQYIDDIDKADKILAPLMSSPKFFRYPFLAEGRGEKRQEVLSYLTANNYVVAPVTIDSKDFLFNARLYAPHHLRMKNLSRIKQQYLAYIWSETLKAEKRAKQYNDKPVRQILLIHLNLLNSYCMRDVIELYKRNGYRFISLAEALQQPVFPIINEVADSPALSTNMPTVLENESTQDLIFEEPKSQPSSDPITGTIN